MKRINRSLKGRYWRKVITYFLTCCLFFNTSLPAVMATPSGGTPDLNNGGGASITYNTNYNDDVYGHTTLVNVDTNRTIINWTSLNTDGGAPEARETLAFTQTLTDSAVLNRVSGAATQFNGDLFAPGMSIFIVNPAGVVFGSESGIRSTVNVTQLVASGLNMSNDAFNAYLDDPVNNKMEFVGGDGAVTTRARIRADSVYLIGKKITNLSPIQAKNGLVVMAAGDEARISEIGSDVYVSVVVNSEGDGLGNPDIITSGNVDVLNGKIILAAGDNFSRAIRNTGILVAQGGTVTANAAIVENRGIIDVSAFPSGADGDGGSVSLTGTDQVAIGPNKLDYPGKIFANAGLNGNGGTININAGTDTVEGKVTIEENSLITALGGSNSGNGGTVTITSDNFEIAGDIDASFGNELSGNEFGDPGKLVINSPSVIIADSDDPLEPDTLYENYIEALSKEGTSLIVNAEEGITVKDIKDDEITGGYGSIELHATGIDSAVSFDDTDNTIRTTLGDIIIEAGSGGITSGNLVTAKDSTPYSQPYPGKIQLTTYNVGDIETGDLIIESGSGTAEIDVKASGDLTVNGDVIVGSVSDILNVADQSAAEAVIILRADNDVTLEGDVEAHANGSVEDTSITKATIDVIAGNDATINGDLWAVANSSSSGTAEAFITVEVVGDMDFPGTANAIANDATADSTGPNHQDDEETISNGHAQIIINENPIVLLDDIGIFSTPKSGADVVLDVLANDILEGEATIVDAYLDNAAEGTLTIGTAGEKTVLLYNPPEDLSVITFDENGEAVVTFTYTVDGKTAIGDVTLINGLPVAVDDLAATTMGKSVNIDVLINDTEPDLDDVLSVIEGAITTKNGTLVLNEDGTFTYTPNEGFVGDDSFTYAATDSFNTTSEVEVKITVGEEPPKQSITPPTPALLFIPPAPIPERLEFEISGSPALEKWVALELGVDERMIDIWAVNTLASTKNIQPYDTYTSLKAAATILKDADGSHIAALTQVINEFASSTAPPTEEQMASIVNAIKSNTDTDSYYAVAGEYLDALVTYISILNNDMGFSAAKSVQFVTDKYVGRLAQGQNAGVVAFIAASLAALGG